MPQDKWEQKIIDSFESIDVGHKNEEILLYYRDWLLGGEQMEWRYYRSKLDGALILERR